MPNLPPRVLVSTGLGIALAGGFAFTGLSISAITLPVLLLPSPSATSPALLPTKEDPAKEPVSGGGSSKGAGKPVSSASHLARQWQTLYDYGKKAGPVVAGSSALAYAVAATLLTRAGPVVTKGQLRVRLLALAAVFDVLVVPYTGMFLRPTNNRLTARASKADEGDDLVEEEAGSETTEDLIKSWGKVNLGRAVFPLLGVASAITALSI